MHTVTVHSNIRRHCSNLFADCSFHCSIMPRAHQRFQQSGSEEGRAVVCDHYDWMRVIFKPTLGQTFDVQSVNHWGSRNLLLGRDLWHPQTWGMVIVVDTPHKVMETVSPMSRLVLNHATIGKNWASHSTHFSEKPEPFKLGTFETISDSTRLDYLASQVG